MRVIDNGSSPDSLRRLRDLAPGVHITETGANLGFGPGANVALRRWLAAETGDWVGIAPHDALPQEGCVARLMAEAAARPRAGLICAEFGGDFDMVPALDKVIGGFYRAAPRGEGWQAVEYPHGTLLLLSAASTSATLPTAKR